jgi:anti-sigma B factor antagonist
MTHVSIDIREERDRHAVVAVAGEIDLATAPLLEGTLRWYRECDLIVDLSAVTLLDASGLTALIRTRKRLRQTGHTLQTTGERGPVLMAMNVTGLVATFHRRIAEGPARAESPRQRDGQVGDR